jgi:hypothetical protein
MAIAYDNAGLAFDGSGTSGSGSFTVGSGTNRILFCGLTLANSGDTLTSVTYNSVAMTQIGKKKDPSSNLWRYLYYLINPSSGSNTLAASSSTSTTSFNAVCSSYSGARQTGQPDSSATADASSATSVTGNTTSVADNSWAIMYGGNFNSALSAGTGSTLRVDSGGGYGAIVDSNGAITPAGATSLQITGSSSNWSAIIATLTPPITISLTVDETVTATEVSGVGTTFLEDVSLAETFGAQSAKFHNPNAKSSTVWTNRQKSV